MRPIYVLLTEDPDIPVWVALTKVFIIAFLAVVCLITYLIISVENWIRHKF